MDSTTHITENDIATCSTNGQPDAFTYAKLNPWYIRVLKIVSASENEAIALSLMDSGMATWKDSPWGTRSRPYSYTNQPSDYIAVSYTWGDQTHMQSISINGKVSQIGQNCCSALRSLAKHYPDRFFWVDAICINQNDTAEKSEQVQIMAEVFRQASLVTSMVGPHADDSKFLFDTITQFHCRHVLHNGTIPAILFDLIWPGEQHRGTLMLGLGGAERALQALVAFSKREYFCRVWIVQEVTVASTVQIICGDDQISLPMIANFSCYFSFDRYDILFDDSCSNISNRIEGLGGYVEAQWREKQRAMWNVFGHRNFSRPQLHVLPMWTAVHIRDDYHQSTTCGKFGAEMPNARLHIAPWSVSYLSLLQRLSSWGCSDVRDMLYGLINISSLPGGFPRNMAPRADYDRSILRTAAEAAQMIDLADRREDIDVIAKVSLICTAFRFSFDHPDIQKALLQRRLSAASQMATGSHVSEAMWTKGYDLCLYGRYSITLDKGVSSQGQDADYASVACTPASKACTPQRSPSWSGSNLVGNQIQESDYLVPLVTNKDQEHRCSEIWLVVRERERGAFDIVGQAFLCGTPVCKDLVTSSCTMDVEDLIVLHCVQQHWMELLSMTSLLEPDLDFVNNTVCGTTSSSWLHSVSK